MKGVPVVAISTKEKPYTGLKQF